MAERSADVAGRMESFINWQLRTENQELVF
jgi:hypothetical protein